MRLNERSKLAAISIFLTTLVLILAGINIVLSLRLRAVTARHETAPQDRMLAVGTKMPPLIAKDSSGIVNRIPSESLTPTIVYVFTPRCTWCAKNLENLKALARHTQRQYRWIGLSLSSHQLAEYVQRNGIEFPIFSEPSEETIRSYKLGGTPTTIVLAPDGRILRQWIGAYGARSGPELERFFKLKLPGLSPS